MVSLRIDKTIKAERRGPLKVYHHEDLSVDAILDILETPGETLKVSKKSVTRQVREWVVKESRPEGGIGLLKHTFRRERYRQGWVAAHYLAQRGVPVPAPVAFVERGRLGVILGNALISRFLEGCRNVEKYAAKLARQADCEEPLEKFFSALVQAVNSLCETGAHHSDLSGKNIFTKDGEAFYFIDLEAVALNQPYTEELRMKNHVQLYDSFCDFVEDKLLVRFLSLLLPEEYHVRDWMPEVRSAQRRRRALIEAKKGRQDVV